MIHVATPPTLMIYLQASIPTLQERIRVRSRPSEQNIPAAYLEHLNHRYDDWLQRFDLCPVLTIPTDDLNIVDNMEHRGRFIEDIHAALGLRADGALQP